MLMKMVKEQQVARSATATDDGDGSDGRRCGIGSHHPSRARFGADGGTHRRRCASATGCGRGLGFRRRSHAAGCEEVVEAAQNMTESIMEDIVLDVPEPQMSEDITLHLRSTSTSDSTRGYPRICRMSAVVQILHEVEMAGMWPSSASITLFLLIPKSTTSERPIALLPTLIRWWESLTAPAVVECKGRHNVTWDGCSKYCGIAETVGWETLLEMETLDLQESQNSIGATTLVVDLAKAFEKVQLNLAWQWAMCF